MKKLFLILWLSAFFGFGWFMHASEYDVTTGRVIATEPVGYDNCDTVTVKTDDRGLVSFVGYGYEGGERVILFMYRNGTYDCSDDTVSGVWVR